MMRGAQSLMRKSSRVLSHEPEGLGRLVGDLKRYGQSVMPCADEMIAVEAILLGLPEDQCRGEYQKKCDERDRKRRERKEDLHRRSTEMIALREEIREALSTLKGRSLNDEDKRQANQILWAVIDGRRPNRPQARHVEGNVVEGPWGDAS
jgi:hypothetical protein